MPALTARSKTEQSHLPALDGLFLGDRTDRLSRGISGASIRREARHRAWQTLHREAPGLPFSPGKLRCLLFRCPKRRLKPVRKFACGRSSRRNPECSNLRSSGAALQALAGTPLPRLSYRHALARTALNGPRLADPTAIRRLDRAEIGHRAGSHGGRISLPDAQAFWAHDPHVRPALPLE